MAVQFAARLALIAFAAANLQGSLTGSDLSGTLQTALIVAALFFLAGLVIGDLSRRVVEENVEKELRELITQLESTNTPLTSN
ncbi:hypothetical protein Pla110_00860 [Polystyrenella longa]|uniref:Uncharacterized protein n=1 Tax=Polystyrenella longa TaxID=2528007 RepID=A0A518CGN0_9PLAN|nr:hypothetical protein [Polystyrenella longa]QDU78385.1 hypothetical protein Pla110_00860 [Polystyrenella longa]